MSVQNKAHDLVVMSGIGKDFAGVPVLADVAFTVRSGEVHVLAGENGAGKSTLMRILCGVYQDYAGQVKLEGKVVRFRSAAQAARAGISMIHQEMSLIPSLSVVDNIFLGRERTRGLGRLDRVRQEKEAGELMGRLGMSLDLHQPAEELPVATRQLVEIAKALAFKADVIVMDEPTSALPQVEADRLFGIIAQLRDGGRGIVYITHRMEEIYRIADRITVLRDGQYVGTAGRGELPQAKLVQWMVGRELSRQFPPRASVPGPERLRVERLHVPDPSGRREPIVGDVSFSLRAGEILGIAGLQGAGNHELLHSLFGRYHSRSGGSAWLDGAPVTIRGPRHAIASGIALLTSDRKTEGLVPSMSIEHNITLAAVRRFSPGGRLRPRMERQAVERHRDAMNIRMRSLEQPVQELSGGNQQKVVLAKWMETRPRLLLLDEPTRGVDVGAKHEIYALMNRWTAEGIAIMLITSELPELLAMSDRIIVMHRGRITGEMPAGEATAERVLAAAMGVVSVISDR